MRAGPVRALLLWPGGLFAGGASFGVPQLLGIARAIRGAADATVDVVDLDMERARGGFAVDTMPPSGYELVGISCYSSFDYLKVMAIARRLRERLPSAWLVAGGYHVSACPEDFTGDDSPFDFAVVGDGERPMARLASCLASGDRPPARVLGPEPTPDPNALLPYDWSLLSKYRPVARQAASQAEIYLSRGCPYDCAFCMERAKRDVSWRAVDPLAAVEELHRLDAFLDLRGFTLFIADALFGMRLDWRRTFLEALARRTVRAEKTWLLIRLDLVEREDLALMARANVAPGFGLESGDPEQVKRVRKTGRLEGYLDRMRDIARWARELHVPFGANLIVGHPGETEASLRATAAYLEEVFLAPGGTTGFVSLDPFRLYPGSPIERERSRWESETGMRPHRYPWWHDGDQAFLSEWVDPSASLDFRACHRLRFELFAPIVRRIRQAFVYDGPATPYFERALDEQIELLSPARSAATLSLWHLWSELTGKSGRSPASVAEDRELASACRALREPVVSSLAWGGAGVREALLEVPRERFVPLTSLEDASEDAPVPLDAVGAATMSAMHAYARAADALSLAPGDDVVELGAGTGYGAAVARSVVGPSGRVRAVEIDPALAARARENLTGQDVTVIEGDAHESALWCPAAKVSVTFAVREVPAEWVDALEPGGVLVAPVGDAAIQDLVRIRRGTDGSVERQRLGPVRFVGDRSARTGT